ncbi:MAG: enolase C-terminal domain-like protein [Spirochaetaceae bacterium]
MSLLDIRKTALTLRTPFAIAHDAYDTRDTIAVFFRGRNTVGHGEAPVVPYYGVTAEVLLTAIRALARIHAPDLEALDPSEGRTAEPLTTAALSVCSAIEADETAHPFARAAVSEAVLDWAAGVTGLRASDLLGFGAVVSTPTSFTIAERDPERARRLTEGACEYGAHCLKIKCGFPGDAELVAAVREAASHAGPREPLLWADCNGGWSAEYAVQRAKALVDEGVTLIEEPVSHNMASLQEVASSVGVPVIADESVRNQADLELLLSQAPDAAGCVLKVAKHGGPLTTARMRDRVRAAGGRYMLGQMVESSVGTAWGLLFTEGAEWVDLDAPALIAEDPAAGGVARPGFFGLSPETATRAGIGAQWRLDLAPG